MAKKLSWTRIQNAAARDKPYELRDSTPGLLVRVQPTGLKTYIVEFARHRRATLGRVGGAMTLDQARSAAAKHVSEYRELKAATPYGAPIPAPTSIVRRRRPR